MRRLISIEKMTFGFVLLTVGMHFFCCILPAVMSLLSLTAAFGLSGFSMTAAESTFDAYKLPLFVFSGAMLLVVGLIQRLSARTDCRRDGACVHSPCDGSKRRARTLYLFSVALFILNIMAMFVFPDA